MGRMDRQKALGLSRDKIVATERDTSIQSPLGWGLKARRDRVTWRREERRQEAATKSYRTGDTGPHQEVAVKMNKRSGLNSRDIQDACFTAPGVFRM